MPGRVWVGRRERGVAHVFDHCELQLPAPRTHHILWRSLRLNLDIVSEGGGPAWFHIGLDSAASKQSTTARGVHEMHDPSYRPSCRPRNPGAAASLRSAVRCVLSGAHSGDTSDNDNNKSHEPHVRIDTYTRPAQRACGCGAIVAVRMQNALDHACRMSRFPHSGWQLTRCRYSNHIQGSIAWPEGRPSADKRGGNGDERLPTTPVKDPSGCSWRASGRGPACVWHFLEYPCHPPLSNINPDDDS